MSPKPADAATTAATTTFVASEYSTGDNFEGWYLQTTPEPIVCGTTETFYTSSTYGDCYNPSTSIPMATGCDGSTLLYEDNLQAGCPTSYSCSAYKIFPTEGADGSEAILKYGCLIGWGADSIYRSLPARFASSTAAPEVTATASISATTDTTTHHHATRTSSSPKPTSTSGSSDSSSEISGGAIAGIVVGCAAAIVIILLLIFRKKIMALFGKYSPVVTSQETNQPAWSGHSMPPQTQAASQTGSAMQPSEMSSESSAVHEIGSSQQTALRPTVVHELS
ncbi:uncharacterized protein N7469_008047 [Penicillium citrinum]|uniref:Uncharacterized protein n=1 Tax=Penicillium citrinum TaxID=5077 RepID=A0A9W9NTV2_PENCI|nr:uncharacterized protein N7469_008047 [Penicillium citrinum]KAJ5224544.1 hypothetical protein N7469_008047 [Penicillium citrinum]